jgi:hypothetical protein
MPDNPEITSRASSETDTLRPRTTEVSTDVHIQHIRLDFGSGTGQIQVEEGVGLPVDVVGTVSVFGPLTDAQLRAGAIAVSGPLTDAALRATPVPVSGTVAVSGTLPISAAALPLPSGAASESKLSELDAATDAWIATQSGSSAAQSLVTVGGSSTEILAANPNRKGLIIRFTDATYVGFDDDADANGMLFEAGAYLQMLTGFIFKGAINGLRVGSEDTTARVVAF